MTICNGPKFRNHPMFTIQKFLNSDGVKPDDTALLRQQIKSYMMDLYELIEMKDGYIICSKPKPNCTKEIAVIWVRKELKLAEAYNFKKTTYPMIKDKNYTRIVVVRRADEAMKKRLAYMRIDRVSYDYKNKTWVNSYRRTKR